LVDPAGVIWGDMQSTAMRFGDLQLSFEEPTKTSVKATEILDKVGILGPIKVGQYSGIRQTFKEFGFVEGENLFYFPYDWRQSNHLTAGRLAEFIRNNKKLAGAKVTLVAHSMGGLVAHIYLQEYGGAAKVSKLITLGTPHFGSGEAFWTFWNGLGGLKNFVVGGEAQVRRTVFSFASMYELLPAYGGCCLLGAPTDHVRTPISVLDYENWLKYTWIPKEIDSPVVRKFVQLSLSRAIALNEVINRPRSPSVRYFKIAGDYFKTYTRVYLDSNSGAPVRWDQFGGDGTVPVLSAAANDLTDSDAAIHAHATIFDDEHVKLRLRRLLTRYNPLEQYSYTSVEGWVEVGLEKTLKKVRALQLSAGEAYQQTGSKAAMSLRIEGEDAEVIRGVAISAWLVTEAGVKNPLITSEDANGNYVAAYDTPLAAGTHRVLVEIPGLGVFDDYFAALSK